MTDDEIIRLYDLGVSIVGIAEIYRNNYNNSNDISYRVCKKKITKKESIFVVSGVVLKYLKNMH